jgi:Tfp pilus assembly protein PilE
MAGSSRQRGFSFFTLIFILAVLGGLGALAVQALPSFLEYQAAIKAINRAKEETTVAGVRNAFDRSANVDNITTISGKDLEVTKDGDRVVVSFAYEKQFHIAGPAYLLLKYAASSQSR